ncbi:MAG: hypothetical protein WA324_23765 [Bryobacteraceae bacterium]
MSDSNERDSAAAPTSAIDLIIVIGLGMGMKNYCSIKGGGAGRYLS